MPSSLDVELFRSNCDRTFVQYFLAQLDMVVFIKMALRDLDRGHSSGNSASKASSTISSITVLKTGHSSRLSLVVKVVFC